MRLGLNTALLVKYNYIIGEGVYGVYEVWHDKKRVKVPFFVRPNKAILKSQLNFLYQVGLPYANNPANYLADIKAAKSLGAFWRAQVKHMKPVFGSMFVQVWLEYEEELAGRASTLLTVPTDVLHGPVVHKLLDGDWKERRNESGMYYTNENNEAHPLQRGAAWLNTKKAFIQSLK